MSAPVVTPIALPALAERLRAPLGTTSPIVLSRMMSAHTHLFFAPFTDAVARLKILSTVRDSLDNLIGPPGNSNGAGAYEEFVALILSALVEYVWLFSSPHWNRCPCLIPCLCAGPVPVPPTQQFVPHEPQQQLS